MSENFEADQHGQLFWELGRKVQRQAVGFRARKFLVGSGRNDWNWPCSSLDNERVVSRRRVQLFGPVFMSHC